MKEEKFSKKNPDKDNRFDKIDKRFDRIDEKLDNHDRQLKKIDEKLDDHDAKFGRVINKLIEHDGRFDQLEANISKKLEKFEDRILAAIDGVVKKTSDVEIEQTSTIAILDRHQIEINSNKKDIAKIKKFVKVT